MYPNTLLLLSRLPPRLARWAPELYAASIAYDSIDPVLLAAIMDRESRGGEALTPPGPSGTGDCGHGRGLMQIDDRYHSAFVSTGLWAEPPFSILYAARLLELNQRALGGSIELAVAAYNCGAARVRTATAGIVETAARLAAADRCTTGGNYASDVLKRREDLYLAALA